MTLLKKNELSLSHKKAGFQQAFWPMHLVRQPVAIRRFFSHNTIETAVEPNIPPDVRMRVTVGEMGFLMKRDAVSDKNQLVILKASAATLNLTCRHCEVAIKSLRLGSSANNVVFT